MYKTNSYCGLDCTKCDAYIATITSDNKLREETAKKWSELNNTTISLNRLIVMVVNLKVLKLYFVQIYVLLENVL